MTVRHLPLLTSSRLKDFRACRRLHHYRYDLLVRSAYEPETTRFGTLIHAGLEAWWRSHGDLSVALDAIAARAADELDAAKARVLLVGYHERWRGQTFEILAVEQQFEGPIVNPATGAESRTFRLGGKVDALVRDEHGRVWVIEHKTTSEGLQPGSDFWTRLRLDTQASTYLVGARILGFEPFGLIYDVIGKPSIRPLRATTNPKLRKDGQPYANQRLEDETIDEYALRLASDIAENPNDYYARGEVVRLEADEADAAYDLWATAREVRETELAKRFPKNPDACKRWNRTCEFVRVCLGEQDIDDPLRFRRAEQAHEELRKEEAAE